MMEKKKLKIAVNTRFLISNKLEGIGTYTHQVLQRLVKKMPEVEFHFLFDREWSQDFIYGTNVFPHKLAPQARHPFLWYYWFEKSVSKWLKNNPVDLFLSLDSFLSLKTDTPTFLVMHDLAFEHYPEHVPFLVRKYYQYFFPKYARKAKHIFAVSNFTKQDVISTYKISEEKISVAYCGVSEIYKPFSEIEKQVFRKQNTNNKPYFICVGSLNPRKNIKRVIEAFNLLKKENDNLMSDYQLLIVGAKAWKVNVLFDEIDNSKFKNEIITTGHLEPQELAKYLASAEALVFPSLFEGFGIPIVEAYKSEVPVITSNCSSTKEIGGDATILVDPHSVESVKQAMLFIAKNKKIQIELVEKGKEKLKCYNWSKTVDSMSHRIIKSMQV